MIPTDGELVSNMGKLGILLVIVSVATLSATLAVVLTSAHMWELYLVALGATAMLVSSRVLARREFSTLCAFVCGGLLPIVPCMGDAALISLVLFYMLIAVVRGEARVWSSLWAAPLLAYGAGNILGEIAIAFDLAGGGATSFVRGVQVDTPQRVADVWREFSQTHAHSWRWFARFLAFVCAVVFFAEEAGRRKRFLQGLSFGVTLSAIFAVVQWFELIPFHVRNQTTFWSSIRRVSGLMSDPNALGIVMALSLWCLALRALERARIPTTCDEDRSHADLKIKRPSERGSSTTGRLCSYRSELRAAVRPAHAAWFVLVVAAGIVSGSRTFMLACAILIAALMWHYARRFLLVGVLTAAIIICAVTALDSYTSVLGDVQNTSRLPEGIKRGISSLSLLRFSQTFASRNLFLEIAQVLVHDHAIFGVGADRFREYVPLVGVQSGLVKGWTDNANNLYAGIGVELGLVGVIMLLLVAVSRTRSEIGRTPLATALLCGLGVIMLTGPHTDFPEVMLLVAFLIGACTRQRLQLSRISMVVPVALLLGIYAASTREQGIFTWDDTDRSALRWLSNRARLKLNCQKQPNDPMSQAVTSLRSVYVPQRGPLEVRIWHRGVVAQELAFRAPQEVQELRISCPPDSEQVTVTAVTRPAWSPYRAWPESSGDRRLLGVEQVVRRQ